jgi:DGQHR domain-containing protein
LSQGGQTLFLTRLRAADLVKLTYVARRGESKERGAVQRFLNSKRIAGIKDFAIAGGPFPNCIILNWVNDQHPLRTSTSTLTIPNETESAQIIDGQHRVAGLEEAIEDKPSLRNLEIPVAIYQNLTTQRSADIFLSINTER